MLIHNETSELARVMLSRDSELSLEGTDDQLNQLREACSELLMRIGFDREYNATREGVALEELVDKLLV